MSFSHDTRTIAKSAPFVGSYTVTSPIGLAGNNYPDNGRGATTSTVGNAHWTDLGLTAGQFEVEITMIILATGCTLTLTELAAGATAHYFQGGATAAQANDTGTEVLGSGESGVFPFPPGFGPRMQDGFKYTLTGAGGTICYRIHVYHDSANSL